MNTLAGLVVMFIVVMAFCSSIRKKPPLKTGDLCTIEDGNGEFAIVKILFLEPERIHFMVYTNRYALRPGYVNPVSLSMETGSDEDAWPAIPHKAMEKADFKEWKPEIVDSQIVTDEELEGYRNWKRKWTM